MAVHAGTRSAAEAKQLGHVGLLPSFIIQVWTRANNYSSPCQPCNAVSTESPQCRPSSKFSHSRQSGPFWSGYLFQHSQLDERKHSFCAPCMLSAHTQTVRRHFDLHIYNLCTRLRYKCDGITMPSPPSPSPSPSPCVILHMPTTIKPTNACRV